MDHLVRESINNTANYVSTCELQDMNIDISNAYCGRQIQFPDHAWLRIILISKTACAFAYERRLDISLVARYDAPERPFPLGVEISAKSRRGVLLCSRDLRTRNWMTSFLIFTADAARLL